jgi:hypothetical protein
LRALLPREERRIGYATHNGHFEVMLWLPVGSRQVTRVLGTDSAESVRRAGVHYVFVDHTALREAELKIDQWLQLYPADVVGTVKYRAQPDSPPETCYLVRLRDNVSGG